MLGLLALSKASARSLVDRRLGCSSGMSLDFCFIIIFFFLSSGAALGVEGVCVFHILLVLTALVLGVGVAGVFCSFGISLFRLCCDSKFFRKAFTEIGVSSTVGLLFESFNGLLFTSLLIINFLGSGLIISARFGGSCLSFGGSKGGGGGGGALAGGTNFDVSFVAVFFFSGNLMGA